MMTKRSVRKGLRGRVWGTAGLAAAVALGAGLLSAADIDLTGGPAQAETAGPAAAPAAQHVTRAVITPNLRVAKPQNFKARPGGDSAPEMWKDETGPVQYSPDEFNGNPGPILDWYTIHVKLPTQGKSEPVWLYISDGYNAARDAASGSTNLAGEAVFTIASTVKGTFNLTGSWGTDIGGPIDNAVQLTFGDPEGVDGVDSLVLPPKDVDFSVMAVTGRDTANAAGDWYTVTVRVGATGEHWPVKLLCAGPDGSEWVCAKGVTSYGGVAALTVGAPGPGTYTLHGRWGGHEGDEFPIGGHRAQYRSLVFN